MPLSCENHRAAIFDRGGTRVLGYFENITAVTWERVRDDFSTASDYRRGAHEGLRRTAPTDCGEPARARHLARPGPRVGRAGDAHLEARGHLPGGGADVIHYLYRTVMHHAHDNAAYWLPNDSDPDKVFINNVDPRRRPRHDIITTELNRKKERSTRR